MTNDHNMAFADVLVFKTNISTLNDVQQVAHHLDGIPEIRRWTIDTEDIDNVLRVETNCPPSVCIKGILHNAGYHCEELID